VARRTGYASGEQGTIMWCCADTTAEREDRGNLTTHLLQVRGVGDDVGRLAAELLQGVGSSRPHAPAVSLSGTCQRVQRATESSFEISMQQVVPHLVAVQELCHDACGWPADAQRWIANP